MGGKRRPSWRGSAAAEPEDEYDVTRDPAASEIDVVSKYYKVWWDGWAEPGQPKQWPQRYTLFSAFDNGIELDQEMWYSVTPEKVAQHQTEMFRPNSILVDPFCGAGGNVCQFAARNFVLAADNSEDRLRQCLNNCQVYGVQGRCDFILGDATTLRFRNVDGVFLSPPWGGDNYSRDDSYPLDTLPIRGGADALCERYAPIAERVALYLPRNVLPNDLLSLSSRCFRGARPLVHRHARTGSSKWWGKQALFQDPKWPTVALTVYFDGEGGFASERRKPLPGKVEKKVVDLEEDEDEDDEGFELTHKARANEKKRSLSPSAAPAAKKIHTVFSSESEEEVQNPPPNPQKRPSADPVEALAAQEGPKPKCVKSGEETTSRPGKRKRKRDLRARTGLFERWQKLRAVVKKREGEKRKRTRVESQEPGRVLKMVKKA